jgi:SAM-dependent methyltransferase
MPADPSEVERLAANYSATADGYAEFWTPVIRPVEDRLLAALPWSGARRCLDVGTGPGTLLPAIQALAPTAAVVGVDRSFGMLVRAARARPRVAVMDAMGLGLRTDTFDVAVMAFVLFHLPDPDAALAEVRRVLRPGGAFALSTWGHDPVPRAGEIWNTELDAWGAWDPSPQTRRDGTTNTPDKVGSLLAAAGLVPERVWVEPIEHQWELDRFIGLRTAFGMTKRKLETLEPGKRRAFLDHITGRLRALASTDFLYRAEAVCAVARRRA